jgi:hypothetical protein
MRVAIVGSRNYPRLDQVRRYIRELPEFTTVVTGGARGVDIVAEEAALRHRLKVEVFEADWEHQGRKAGVIRNAHVVDYVDFVVAFWDGESRGTKNVIDLCRSMVKPFAVVFP